MAFSIEQLIDIIQEKSASGNFKELNQTLLANTSTLSSNAGQLDTFIETLTDENHSLGVLFALVAKLESMPAIPDDVPAIANRVAAFMAACDPQQVRCAYKTFCELSHLYTGYMNKHRLPLVPALNALRQAIGKVCKSDTHLTHVHADFFQISLSAKLLKPALQMLDADIVSLACTGDSYLDARYFLLYYYYAGTILGAAQRYERALYCFEVAITTPAVAMSHIMLEAYKKYVLLSLLQYGNVVTVPKYSSQVVTRYMKPLSQAYVDLIAPFQARNTDEMNAVRLKNRDVYERDNNLGLVKLVAKSLYRKNIKRLTQTFVTLSLADVASRAKLSGGAEEAERYLLDMIRTGEIAATINQRDGMVQFLDEPRRYDTPEVMQRIQGDMLQVMKLHGLITRKENAIMVHPSFVLKFVGMQDESDAMVKSMQSDPIASD